MPPAEQEEKTFFQKVAGFFIGVADWVKKTFSDPVVRNAILMDLGAEDPGGGATPELPDTALASISDYASKGKEDADKQALMILVDDIKQIVDSVQGIVEASGSGGALGAEITRSIMMLFATTHARYRFPEMYTFATFTGILADDVMATGIDDEALGNFFSDTFGSLFSWPTEQDAQRASDIYGPGLLGGAWALSKRLGSEGWEFDALYGWEQDPSVNPVPLHDKVSARTLTLRMSKNGEAVNFTISLVPDEHGGPGLMIGIGGSATITWKSDPVSGVRRDVALEVEAPTAVDAYIPLGGPGEFSINGPSSVSVNLRRNFPATETPPPVIIGNADGTRIEISRPGYAFTLGNETWGIGVDLRESALVVQASEGDGFLNAILPREALALPFDLVVGVDGERGFYIEGGSGLNATIPVNRSVFGLKVQHIVIGLTPPSAGTNDSFTAEFSGAFGLSIGPFKASVDRMGFLFDLKIGQGNLGILDADTRFKPPNGIGLALDAQVVKGGGYLFFDHERGEYAGALELKFGPVSLKAFGILTTQVPGGSGWSLLLAIYGEFPPIQLGFGFALTGAGGIIGLQHAVAIEALQAGLKTGALDDVLFPRDPVADAPRILNTLRTVFPPTADQLTVGPMFELVWGASSVIRLRLGVLLQWSMANEGTELRRVTILGQLRSELPTPETAQLRIIVDILGDIVWEDDAVKLSIDARLRDSKVSEFTLTGALAVRAVAGPNSSFLLAAGGVHPKFEDKPPGFPDLDRIGFSIVKGPARITLGGYFAVSSNTVQAGAAVDVVVEKAGAKLELHVGFDLLFVFEPRFSFIADLSGRAKASYKGVTLFGLGVELSLSGPGRWRAHGKATIEVLFWDIEVKFDESWGDAPDEELPTANVQQKIVDELSNRANWSAQLPAGGDMLVTLRKIQAERVLAHPLGDLTVRQKVVPLGLQIDRVGNSRPSGARQFEITDVLVSGTSSSEHAPVREQFAPAQYLDLTEAQKLSRPSFEAFDAGVRVGTDRIVAGPEQVRDLDYETIILRRQRPFVLSGVYKLGVENLLGQARFGAVGRSAIHNGIAAAIDREAIGAAVTINEPSFVAVSDVDMSDVEGTIVAGSSFLLEQMIASDDDLDTSHVQVVEAHEVAVMVP